MSGSTQTMTRVPGMPADVPAVGETAERHWHEPALAGGMVAACLAAALIAWWYPAAVKTYYLLFHSVAEMFAVIISAGIFMVAWNSRRFVQNHYLLWIGIGYLAVAIIELMHTLAYKGMNVFPGRGNNLPTQLWVAARYAEAAILIAAPIFLTRKLNARIAFIGWLGLTAAVLLTTIVWPVFPAAYDNHAGRLTAFKVVSEYVVCGLLVAAAVLLLLLNKGQFGRRPMGLLIGSMVMTIMAEMAFTQYSDPYGPANLLGHLLTVISFFLIYKALIETGLRDPYEVMFRRLRNSERRYHDLFGSMSEGFALHEIICDAAGRPVDYRFLEINPAFGRLTGLKPESVIGRRVLDVLPGTEPIWIERFGKVALTGEPAEFTSLSGELGRHYQVYAFSPAIGQFAVIFMDVTDRKQAAEKLDSLNRELEQRVAELGNANDELESFAYSVSHDLRAPLRAIDGFSQALIEDCAEQLDQAGREHLDRIRAGSQRMGQLIDDILGLSRVTRSKISRQQVDLSRMAREVVDNLDALEPRRTVKAVIQPGLTAEADPRLLRVLLENLLGNAWKFTSRSAEPKIEFGASADDSGGGVEYYVRDNGAGFDQRYVDKLFGPFQRLHRSSEFPGSGIGLATVHRVVRRHGGRVRAEGRVGRGATFYFTLASEAGKGEHCQIAVKGGHGGPEHEDDLAC